MESCSVDLMGPVELGHTFVIAGFTALGCKNFKIVFSGGGDDIPVNILVDMKLKQFVINSCESNQWSESVKADTEFLGDREFFKFYLLVSDTKVHVALNDRHLTSFPCRLMIKEAKRINIFGDLEQISQVDHRRVYPSPWPPVQEDLPTIAFSSDFPFNFLPGSAVVLKMRVSGSPQGSFFIRFNELGSKRQLFHFSSRFDEKAVVVNSMNDSLEWMEHENRTKIFPFCLNKMFTLAIAITSTSFKVAVDGNHLITFDLKMIPVPLTSAFSRNHIIFDRLTGLKLFALQGMKAYVSEVKHYFLKEDCKLYEKLSVNSPS